MTNLQALESLKGLYLDALRADAVNPKPDYSIDGQTVSRAQWRQALIGFIKDINALLQQEEPYELKGSCL